jgi:capsular polysaccharide transport system permease protein
MGLVAVVAALYYAFIAAPMYVSETRFSVRTQQPSITGGGALQALSSAQPAAVVADVIAIQDQIQSHEMLDALNKEFHLRESYSRFRPDLLHWLRPGASEEALLRFYRRMIVIKIDREAGIVEVDARSFDKATAPKLAEAILKRTEAFVDGMSVRVRSDSLKTAQAELDRARQQAEAARAAVGAFRGAASTVDPAAAGAQVQGAQAALTAQAATIRAELASALTFNRPNSPAVRQIRARLAAVEAQAARFRSEQGAGGQSRQVTDYEALVVQRQTAESKLALATTAYEAARAEAQQQQKYIVRVVNPNTPDRPTEPKRLRDFLTVMIFALAGYAIVSLAIAGIRDHRGV